MLSRCLVTEVSWCRTVRTLFAVPCVFLCMRSLMMPPDIVVGGLRSHLESSIYLSSFLFVSYSPNSLNRTRSKPATWSEVSVIVKSMSDMWCITSPYQSGPQNHLFTRLRNSKGNVNGLYLGMKHDIHNRVSALQTTRGFLYRLKMSWTLVHKRLKIGQSFSPILSKFCILLHCQASQTEVSKRNSTKLCQTVESE